MTAPSLPPSRAYASFSDQGGGLVRQGAGAAAGRTSGGAPVDAPLPSNGATVHDVLHHLLAGAVDGVGPAGAGPEAEREWTVRCGDRGVYTATVTGLHAALDATPLPQYYASAVLRRQVCAVLCAVVHAAPWCVL